MGRRVENAAFSSFPYRSWLGFRVTGRADGGPFSVHMRSVAATISLTVWGRHAVDWITRGRETRWEETAGAVHFNPADGEEHTFITAMSPDFLSAVWLIPEGHLRDCLESEGCDSRVEFRRLLAADDPVLRSCMEQLSSPVGPDGDDVDRDAAARRLVLRLAELTAGSRPDWHADSAVFNGRTLGHLVDYIDAHLKIAPSLGDMAMRVGLSPSHFAKKFRQTTGLSLQRFINRRRIRAAMDSLRNQDEPLAQVALDHGFTSQSHLTRLFSDLTGLTPAKFRKLFRRTVG